MSKIYNISGIVSDLKIEKNSNGNEFAYAKVTKGDKVTAVFTHVKAGIEALKVVKDGDAVRLYGTYVKGDKGQTFSAMGVSPEKAVEEPAPVL